MSRDGARPTGPSRVLPRRVALPAGVLAVLLLMLAWALPAQAAQARSARAAVPKLPAGERVPEALELLRSHGFKAAVLRADGYPDARPGHAFVVAGWALQRRAAVRAKRGGKATFQVRYVTVRPGTRLAARTRIHVRVRQVAKAAAPAPVPAASAPVAAAAQPAPAAVPSAQVAADPVNAGGTPLVSVPPAASQDAPAAPPAAAAGGSATVEGEVQPPPAPPAPAPAPAPIPAPPAPTPPKLDLAAETARFLRSETVHLPFMNGCTGFLVRGTGGQPIGAVSAVHCGLLPERTPRVTGSDGRTYVVAQGALEVRNGEDVSTMRAVATPRTVTLAPDADRTHDLALISFEDSAAAVARVRAAYEAMRLSPADLDALPAGGTVTLSAFPKAQPLNKGVTRRQVMTGTVLGQAPVYTTSRRTIPTVWTAMKANADGAVCSYGASGGAGVVASVATGPNGPRAVFRLLGVLSGFDDFRSAGQNTVGYDGAKLRLERQSQTGFDLASVDATCNYAHELPAAATAQTIRLVASAADIP